MENQVLDQEEAYSEEIKFASFWERTGASLIDGLILLPIIILNFYNMLHIKSLPLAIALSLIFLVYKVYMEGQYGATFGKRAMKIKVIMADNTPINYSGALGRNALYIFNALVGLISTIAIFNAAGFDAVTKFTEIGAFQKENGDNFGTITSVLVLISCLFVIFDKKKQALHDKIAKTYVVSVN